MVHSMHRFSSTHFLSSFIRQDVLWLTFFFLCSLFFDACDGIFLNYCWTLEKLAASKEVAMQKNRPFDVFVGIDVFGRGCPGGGGFNTREVGSQSLINTDWNGTLRNDFIVCMPFEVMESDKLNTRAALRVSHFVYEEMEWPGNV